MKYSRDRVLALSDGVFAIAITLLGLEVVPHIGRDITGAQLHAELRELVPYVVAYGISFVVIGRFWDNHRSFYRHIQGADARLVGFNLLVLLWIVLVPASAALLGSHLYEPIAVTLYALNLLFTTVSLWLLWRHAESAGCVDREALHERAGTYIDRFTAVSAVGYALAILAAYVLPTLSLVLVFLTTTLARSVASRVFGGESDAGSEVISGIS